MNGDWDFYLTSIDSEVALVFLDLAYGRTGPVRRSRISPPFASPCVSRGRTASPAAKNRARS